MKTTREILTHIADETKDTPAITASKADQGAYNKDIISLLWERYMHKEAKVVLREKVKAIPRSQPLARLDMMSRGNIDQTLKDALEILPAAEAKYGADVVRAVIAGAQEECKFSNLSLTHSPSWDGSSYADEDNLPKILEAKALSAPSIVDPGNTDSMIYTGMVKADSKVDLLNGQDTFFRINNVPEKDFRRSLIAMKVAYPAKLGQEMFGPDDRSIVVGGNHMKAAWVLATVNNELRTMIENNIAVPSAAQAKQTTIDKAVHTLNEMMTPNQIKLQGQIFVDNGEEKTIGGAARAVRKPAAEKKDLSADPANEQLKRKPRGRAKTDEE